MKKLIFILLIFSLIFLLSLKTLAAKEEVGEWLREIWNKIKEKWEKEIMPIFKRMWDWFKENIWVKVSSLLKTEYEKRKPEIKEEFERKEKEIRKEIPQIFEKIWEKISSLFKSRGGK
jgi:predicted transcriptional regulator